MGKDTVPCSTRRALEHLTRLKSVYVATAEVDAPY